MGENGERRPDPTRVVDNVGHPICGATHKRIYTRKEAMRQASSWRHRFARMRHYRCHKCDGWHIGNDRQKPRRRR